MTPPTLKPPSVPLAVIDALSSLLESELQSLFRQLQKFSPHLDRANADLRRPLNDMAATAVRHGHELAALIESLGGTPTATISVVDEQYLAYLSFKFFLPKLIDACRLAVQRYTSTLAALPDAPDSVRNLLSAHLADYRAQLALLEQAAARH